MKSCFLLVISLVASLATAKVLDVKVIEQGGSGPYSAVATKEQSLPEFVVYRPQRLSKAVMNEGPLPVLIFANGGCNDTSLPFENMLSEIASHGYIVIALGAMQRNLQDRELRKTDNSMMIDALEWISEQAKATQSDFFQNVSLTQVASAGQSCGGAQVLATAADSRFKSYLLFNSGIGDMTMSGASRQSLENLHAPIIYLVGGETDVATENAKLDYQRIEHVPVVFANHLTAGHSGTFSQTNGGSFTALAIKWLDWQMKGNEFQGKVFNEAKPDAFPDWRLNSKATAE